MDFDDEPGVIGMQQQPHEVDDCVQLCSLSISVLPPAAAGWRSPSGQIEQVIDDRKQLHVVPHNFFQCNLELPMGHH